MQVALADIEAANQRLDPVVRRTPLLSSPFLDEIAGKRVFVKPECLQHTGSFKFRGGWSAISAMSNEQRQKGVVAYSSGNHAQGVARAAQLHNIPSVIIMPSDAPELKIENTRAYGAEVVLYDRDNETREEIGARYSEERGMSLIKPYDDPAVIAGQGTIGIELAVQTAIEGITQAEVLVPCGGGGMTSGISIALASQKQGLRVRPVEPEGFDDVTRSLASGEISTNNAMSGSLCDAILTPAPAKSTFDIMSKYAHAGLVVTDEEALMAMAHAFSRLKIVVEPGGAVALAAALFHGDEISSDTVVCVASGGNADSAIFRRALQTLE